MAAPGPTLVPMRGLLAGIGSRPLYVSVCTAGAPAQPPPQLADVVRPIRDDDGRVADWRLDVEGGEMLNSPDVLAEYREWHGSFSTHHYIGECAFANAVVKWAHPHCNVSALDFVRQPEAHVGFKNALAVRSQTERLARLLHSVDEKGLGVFAPPEHHSAVRGFLPAASSRPLLATDRCKAFASPDGVRLQIADATELTVRGWEQRDGTLSVDTAQGRQLIDDVAVQQILSALGKRAARVEVRPEPLRALAAMLLVSLRDAAALAAKSRTGFSAFAGPSLPYLALAG